MAMRTASKRVAIEIVACETHQSERRGASAELYWLAGNTITAQLKFIASVLFFCASAFSQSVAVSSPTATQTLSGVSFPLAVTLASLPSVASVEYIVDGESQGIVWSSPWSIPAWNTNNRYNGP